MRRVLVWIIAFMLVMPCITLIGCSSSDKSEPNDDKDDSAAKLAAWLARMSFKPEWLKQTWPLSDGTLLLEVDGGGATDGCKLYGVFDKKADDGRLIAGIAHNAVLQSVSPTHVDFTCHCTDANGILVFPYRLTYDIEARTTTEDELYVSPDSIVSFGLRNDAPTEATVTMGSDGCTISFAGQIPPYVEITGVADTRELRLALPDARVTADTTLEWQSTEAGSLIASMRIASGTPTSAETGTTIILTLRPWSGVGYQVRADEADGHTRYLVVVRSTDEAVLIK